MSKFIAIFIATALFACLPASAQNAAANASATKPIPVIGTITAVNPAAHTVTMKQDKTGTEYTVEVGNTKTLLKVEPTAKDLKNATRITADDLAAGDRIEVGALKSDTDPNTLVARSVILMSARDLEKVHQEEATAWQHSTPGVVSAVDPASHMLTVSARTPEGPKTINVNAASAVFTRYAPANPKIPAPSDFADVQPGDQVRIIGQMNGDTMTASQIYTSSFRNVVGTVVSISPDGKQITVKDLQTKQPITVTLSDDSSVRKLPQMMAYMLARRFNPDFKMPQGGGAGAQEQGGGGNTGAGATGGGGGNWHGGQGQGGGNWSGQGQGQPGQGGAMHGGMASGDLSQTLDRLPKISTTDLKNGDAVIVSGTPVAGDKSHLLATNIIAGVEPIFQSAPRRQSQALSDWGASLSGGAGGGEMGMPGGGGGPPQ